MFFELIGKTRWPPWPLIGWDIFDFFFETTERNSTNLDRKQDLNALYQVCVFRADRKNKMAAFDWLRHFPLQSKGSHLVFSDRPEKHKLCRGHWDLASCQVSLNSILRFLEEKSKMSQPIRGHLVFSTGQKKTNYIEDIKILLPVKFHWIPFSGFRGEVENVKVNDNRRRTHNAWSHSALESSAQVH